MKKFYQCDVSDDGSIWTSSVHYCASQEEAEFRVMVELQQDWGDWAMPDEFVLEFGDDNSSAERVFPGEDAWDAGGYWDNMNPTMGMLPIEPLEAFAQLNLIQCDLAPDHIQAVLDGTLKLKVVIDTTGGPS